MRERFEHSLDTHSVDMTETHSVAVVGAGFSGTILVAHLLRRSRGSLRIYLINKSGRLARGVAYGTRSSRHVLNVPAGRMSAFAEDETDFLRFAQRRDPGIQGGSFVPRHLYGDYLEHILLSAQSESARGTVLSHVADEVLSIDELPDEGTAIVNLAHGAPLAVNRVVIAAGNYAPTPPPLADTRYLTDARFIADPWKPRALDAVAGDRPVVIVGTGLTMVDIALELASRGHTGGMTAISRRGLVPQPHRHGTSPPSYGHLPPDLIATAPTASNYLRAVRRHARKLEREGIDWREVVASLRPVTPRLWRALPDAEKSRFLRHLRPYWEVHRHRMAPELWAALHELVATTRLQVVAARLTSVEPAEDSLRVSFRRRERAHSETVSVSAVINCTGPESDVRRLRDPLVRDLIARGLATCDTAGLGIRVDDAYRVIGSTGAPSPVLSLTGPLLKGEFWEATAVPELRVHAARLAERIASELA
jgi:uncharacterized NAD(P)/FAD-binding protein YdhS